MNIIAELFGGDPRSHAFSEKCGMVIMHILCKTMEEERNKSFQHSKQNNNCPYKESLRVAFSMDPYFKRGNISLVGCDFQQP